MISLLSTKNIDIHGISRVFRKRG